MNYIILGINGAIGRSILNNIYNPRDNFILTYHSKKPNIKKKNIFLFNIDFSKPNKLKSKIIKIIKKFKKIDVLINNVGNANPYKDILKVKLSEIENSMKINFYSPLTITLLVLKNNIKFNKKLNVINISTNTIKFFGSRKNLPYLVSKNALETALLNLSKQYSKKLIKINIIRPGVIESKMKNNIKNYSKKDFVERKKLIPVGKAGMPIDISNAVNFLISDKSNFVYGQILTISGGE